jgi:hypothetical protein
MNDEKRRAELEKIWLAKVEVLGPEIVRVRYTERRPVTDTAPYPDAGFVETWLRTKERDRKREAAWAYSVPLLFTFVSAIAACIAAWPVAKDWIPVVKDWIALAFPWLRRAVASGLVFFSGG